MNEELITDKLELSKLYFKTKCYDKALVTYTNVLDLMERYSRPELISICKLYKFDPPLNLTYHPKIISVLDQRAATFEKLNNHGNAIKDGQKVITMNPIEIKGYLRVGKIYRILNNNLKAFKIYQQGVYTIKKFREKNPKYQINKELWKKLVNNYNELNSLLKSQQSIKESKPQDENKRRKKNLDPFNYLDYDVLYIIFQHVTSVFKYHLVCKNWYLNLRGFPKLYQIVQLKSRISFKEFSNGVPMFESLPNFQLSITQTTDSDFNRIIELMISKNMNVTSLEILKITKFNQLLTKFDKYKFNFNFKRINTFKLLTDSPHFSHVINLFPNLTHLEIILTDLEKDSPLQLQYKQAFKKLTEEYCESLVTLSLINHRQNISPPFMSQTFNLTNLIIVNFNFNNIQHIFGTFIQKCSNLKKLVLEDNLNFSFKHFLNNLINYRCEFQLEFLMFREYSIISPTNLSEFNAQDFHNFIFLSTLDLYSTSLSNMGLLKLLGSTKQLETLTLGCSNYLHFRNDFFSNHQKISLIDILKIVPTLHNLSLIDLNLDNTSCRAFNQDLTKLPRALTLDLSFNAIDGIGIFGLLSGIDCITSLTTDGVSINKDSIALIEKRVRFKNDSLKSKWRVYGVNSYVL